MVAGVVSRVASQRRRVTWLRPEASLPLLVSALSATLFVVIEPGVPDLEAALAHASASSHGVGLTYWFQWFGGGSTPGQYSVLTPWLSAWLTAPGLGALATVALTPLVDRVLAGTTFRLTGTWVAATTAGLSLWSGRIAFALGLAVAVVALIGLRERRVLLAVLGVIGSVCASPVAGAFLAMALLASGLVERQNRRLALLLTGLCGTSLLAVAWYFGMPGPAIYRPVSAELVIASSLLMLVARPAPAVRVVACMTAIASVVLVLVPNGMGSNLSRMPYICLPVAVVATAAVRRWVAVVLVAPALVSCGYFAYHDLRVASYPAASTSYYDSLARELDRTPQLRNYRLEVVQSRSFHTADYALLDHAALATGWETQQLQALDPILKSPLLNAASYRSWMSVNAVGYVAFDRRSPDAIDPEYKLVAKGLRYLKPVWRDSTWTFYRVENATPIVPKPAALVAASQSELTVRFSCTCPVPVRVRWSKFLTVTDDATGMMGAVGDSDGWTVVTVPHPGTYELEGRL